MRRHLILLAAAGACAAPPAPTPPTSAAKATLAATATPAARRFLPVDYEGELFVDWAALRACGLLDQLERQPMVEPLLAMLAREYGCSLDDLATTRSAFPGTRHRNRSIGIAELAAGATPIATPAEWQRAEFGPHRGYRYGTGSTARAVFWPDAHTAVNGSPDLVAQQLAAGGPGGPHPELEELLGGDGVLAQLAYGRFGNPYDDVLRTFGPLFGDEQDPVDFIRIRLASAAGDGGDDDLSLTVTMRYHLGTTGITATAATLRSKLDELAGSGPLAALASLLRQVAITRSDRDLTVALPLGSPRAAITTVERILVVAMAATSRG